MKVRLIIKWPTRDKLHLVRSQSAKCPPPGARYNWVVGSPACPIWCTVGAWCWGGVNDLVWTTDLCAATTFRSSRRPRLGDLHRTVQVRVSNLQPVNCDSLCLSSDVQFEGLSTRFNYTVGALIGPLKWSPMRALRLTKLNLVFWR